MGARRTLAVALGAAIALLAVPASDAAALKEYDKPFEAGDAGIEQVRVKCNRGEQVVSGGFFGQTGDHALVNMARDKRSWLVKGDFTLGASQAYAYCSKTIEVETAEATKGFDEDDEARPSATCKPSQNPVAGGWAYTEVSESEGSPVHTSYPVGRRWIVEGFTSTTLGNPKLTSYAYCMPGDVKTEQGEWTTASSSAFGSQAGCNQRQQLLGGGFVTFGADYNNMVGPDPFFNISRIAGKRNWGNTGFNYSTVGGDGEAIATCLK